MGPAPWTRQFDPWQAVIPTYRCPSDPGSGLPAHGRTNYVACLGDATHWLNTGATRFDGDSASWVDDRQGEVDVSGRGMFVPRRAIAFREISDGLSNTILSPNREVCLAGGDSGIGMLPPSSRHQGGVHVLMGDGAVRFITDSIEAGDSASGTVIVGGTGVREPGAVSPYGLWGALGTRGGVEEIDWGGVLN